MPEVIAVIHAHTLASDGRASFEEIVQAARDARVDVLITTDHNVLPLREAGYRDGVLLLVGQEVNDIERQPEVNHLLCIGVTQDVTELAASPQALINGVNAQGALAFIAHPIEYAPAYTHEPAIPWTDWDVEGFHGIEIWNYMSEFKAQATGLRRGAQAAYWPTSVISGPFPETLALWDRLLTAGRVVAIGGPDAHGWQVRRGPLRPTILPYPFLMSAVRMHLLVERPLVGDFAVDRDLVLTTIRAGHCFMGYDAIGDTRGFNFTARRDGLTAGMGDDFAVGDGVELRVEAPRPAELRLLRDGTEIATVTGRSLRYLALHPGVYRVEAYRRHLNQRRGWVFTNPIYLTGGKTENEASPCVDGRT